jgi:hypothetical protein
MMTRAASLALIALVAFAATGRGDLVSHSPLSGDAVVFRSVASSSADLGFLPGTYWTSGNSLFITGRGFAAHASGNDFDFADNQLALTIQAKDGFRIDSLTFTSMGSFSKSDHASLFAQAFGVAEVDGSLYSGGFDMSFDRLDHGGWLNSFTIHFPATNQVTLLVDEGFLAFAGLLESAMINSNSVRITANTVAIPEPATIGLVGLASCCGLGFAVARRKRHAPGRLVGNDAPQPPMGW